ncbi:hypothetical protein AXF42_Ash010652 [Apostasia shenzhenica]|uniref:Uncharacterized protein n=1 Tax=Apostasia shenzhenica TaxID=1088818 RepID=A0A2I0A6N3_9ASPA|nr:hypothetical protein AXF42_Ash010652 [Apostasia shenzhenica]
MAPSTPPFRFHPLKSSSFPMKQFSPFPTNPKMPESNSGGQPRTHSLLRPHQRTNPLVWLSAFLCVIFILLLISAGVVTLVVFLVIKPKNPSFDTTSANLNSIYLDSPPFLLNGDLTFLANFSNPNSKIDMEFEYASLELFFSGHLVAAQALQPFVQRRGQARLEAVHMISSQVYLPPDIAGELIRQVRSNRVLYNIRGTFKVRARMGIAHFAYWIYGRCQIELTSPPSGVLVARSCSTKR